MKRCLSVVFAIALLAFLASCTLGTFVPVTDSFTSDPDETDIPRPTSPMAVDTAFPSIHISFDAEDTLHLSYYIDASISVKSGDYFFADFTDKNAKVRIRGNSTAIGAKKPLNIKFSKSVELFGLGKAKKWCLLANMYDKSLMRNKLALDFARSVGLSNSSNAKYVNLFINNEYMGNYLLCESVGVGKSRVDIDQSANEFLLEFEPFENYKNELFVKTDIYGLTFGLDDTDFITEEQISYLTSFLNSFEYALKIKNSTFDEFSKYIDVESFVNFYIVNELFKNVDFSLSSTRFYIKSGKLYAGPAWDFDLSAGNCSADYYPTYNNYATGNPSSDGLWCREFWFADLMENDMFSTLVANRYSELQPLIVNLTDDNSLGTNKIDELINRNLSSFRNNYERWDISSIDSIVEWQEPFSSFEDSVEFLRAWLKARNKYLLGQFRMMEDDK